MIEKLEVVSYRQGLDSPVVESFDHPKWQTVAGELSSMHAFEKPILTLSKFADIPDGDLMMVHGGGDRFHIQVVDAEATWFQAINPKHSEAMVDVWTSDQGFTCEERFTWPSTIAHLIIKHYFETGRPYSDIDWI